VAPWPQRDFKAKHWGRQKDKNVKTKCQSKPTIRIIRKDIANELNYTEVRNNGRQAKELRCQTAMQMDTRPELWLLSREMAGILAKDQILLKSNCL